MKRVVSVSLGSSKRNHSVETNLCGHEFLVERIGTDGDMNKAIKLIKDLDGQVDAFGMGGIDLYIWAGNRRFILRDAVRIAKAAVHTPIVDGSGLKNTLERRVIQYLDQERVINFKDKKVLMVCALDRFGMAEALLETGCDMTFGDLVFVLGLPIALTKISHLYKVAAVIGPIVSQLPFKMLYPTGQNQEKTGMAKSKYYDKAEIIAGDYHLIKRYMPDSMVGKTIITNTVTKDDIKDLTNRGVHMLVTTTPELNGRSFGTNVMEGVLVALAGKGGLVSAEYEALLEQINFKPRVEVLNQSIAL